MSPIHTAHPHWPLHPGTWIQYDVFEITGRWHPSLHLDVLTRKAIPGRFGKQRLVVVDLPSRQPIVGITTVVADESGQWPAVLPNAATHNPAATLVQGLWTGPNTPFNMIGEMISQYETPEPVLGFNMSVGDHRRGTSRAYNFAANGDVWPMTLPWQFNTLYQGDVGPWSDCIITALLEDTVQPEGRWIYNYCFQRGVGMVNRWYGLTLADGTVPIGYEFYMTGKGAA